MADLDEYAGEFGPGAALMGRRLTIAQQPTLAVRVANNGLTDTYQARRFVAKHGHEWRFDHTRKKWLRFHDPLWRPEEPGDLTRTLIACAQEFQVEARRIRDNETREKALRWAKYLESDTGLRKVRTVAQDLEPCAVDATAWNRDPWLLGAPNGIIDLKHGRLLQAGNDAHVTRSVGVAFDPHAASPRWLRFLSEVFDNDTAVVDYIQRVLGYFLTGLTSAQLWWLLYGEGANGKTTLLNIVAHVLGEYATTVPFSMFQLQQQRSTIPDDLATLPGKRLIHASETIEGKRLDEARMKALTGSDRIAARPLFGQWFEFEPSHKVVLSCNHKPVVKDDSQGFWRRVHLIPFTQRFDGPRRDNHLDEQLKIEGSGILAWMVQGSLRWHREGLQAPKAIEIATLGYRRDSDHLPDFLLECCELREDGECEAAALQNRYREWSDERQLPKDQRHSPVTFGERMAGQFSRVERSSGRVYIGLVLRSKP